MAKKKKRRKEIRQVPLDDIKQGPIRHKKGLTPLLEKLARSLFSKVGHFAYPTFEQWELGFMRDKHPWREILLWENIARTFDLYLADHPEAANNKQVVGLIAAISTGYASKNETELEKELRKLFLEAARKQWTAPPGEPFDFVQDEAMVLQYEDIVDEWDGDICPNLGRHFDPRRVLADADIILGKSPKSDECFCLYGRDRLEEGRIPEGLKTLVVCLDPENEKRHELEKMCHVVQQIKGRYDSP